MEIGVLKIFVIFRGKKIEYRRLILFTNFDHQFSDDSLEQIIQGFQSENNVQLNVM